jgi:hypothetical protein
MLSQNELWKLIAASEEKTRCSIDLWTQLG